jgi:F-type H+-transporting ATPase subunit alpha
VTNGYLDGIPLNRIRQWERGFHEYLDAQHPDVLRTTRERKVMDEAVTKALVQAIKAYSEAFAAGEGAVTESVSGAAAVAAAS